MAEEWLLTVKERQKIWDDTALSPILCWEDDLLRAQLRKVAEKLYGILSSYPSHPESSIWFGQLRKEAGLDA